MYTLTVYVYIFFILSKVSTTPVASIPMGHWGTCPLEFWKLCAFCNCCQLNCKDFENHQRKTCIKISSIWPETR